MEKAKQQSGLGPYISGELYFGLFKDLFGGITLATDLEEGPRELVNVQASLPPSSGPMNPHEEEIKQRRQETCMDERGTPSKSQTEERNV